MKQTFVNNIQQLMTANQNQRIKISYLQSQKQKRQQYLLGLKQSILLNKQTLIVINQQGPNLQALDFASRQNLHLINTNDKLYTQNRQLNALLLMEQQLKTQEKDFYLERINQFENRISDLRKYLHDKQESFSTVVTRLKKYQEWNEKPLSEKIQDTEGLNKLTHQMISKLLIEKNMLKQKFQQVFPDANRFQLLKQTIKNPTNLHRFIQQANKNSQKILNHVQQDDGYPKKQLIDIYLKQKQKNKEKSKNSSATSNLNLKPSQINKQIMRLLKKQKLNNQILQGALNNAIQKNQQLLKINQNLQLALNMVERKMKKLIAQNYFYSMKYKVFNSSYGKKYALKQPRDDYDDPTFVDLFKLEYKIEDQENQEISPFVYKSILNQSLKQDIERILKIPLKLKSTNSNKKIDNSEKINQMTTNDMTRIKENIQGKNKINQETRGMQSHQNDNTIQDEHQKVMVKSASQPRIIFQWEGTNEEQNQQQEMIVDQF